VKIGHGGTLDPMASGVLPVCIGEATKLAPFLLDADKEYEALVRFGVETDTLDAEGQVVARRPVPVLDAEAVEGALAAFRGAIDQVPPMYSALKRAGRPLYAYARAGETLERPPRRVFVHALDLLGLDPPDGVRLRVRCSKGTYVRSLAADLGRAMGHGAHLAALRRTASGPFDLAQAISLQDVDATLTAGADLSLVSPADALGHLASAAVDAACAAALRTGRRLTWDALGSAPIDVAVRVLDADGDLVAVVTHGEGGRVRVARVFRAASLPRSEPRPARM